MIGPAVKQVGRHAAWQQRGLGRSAEQHAGAGPRGAGDLLPQRVELGIGHPVLRIEQDIAIARGIGQRGEMLGEIGVKHGHAAGAGAHGVPVPGLEIGRQRPITIAGIAARKGLPGEIVLFDRKIAGQLFQAAAQHLRHALVPGQGIELRRGDAKTKQRGGLVGQPAHEALVEHRRQFALEHGALRLLRGGGQDLCQVDAIELGQQMRHADEIAEQPALVDALGKAADAAPANQVASFPIAARRLIEHGRQMRAIGRDVGRAIRLGEKAVEGGMVGKALRRRQLELVERDMRGVEIDRRDAFGIGHQIGQHVAPAAGDGHHAAVGQDLQGVHVDIRVFPDLRIDQPAKRQGKGMIEQAVGNAGALAHDRAGDRVAGAGLAPVALEFHGQCLSHSYGWGPV